MSKIKAYHRPASLQVALQHLAQPDTHVVPVAGGVQINAHLSDTVDEVVDLQAIPDLAEIREEDGRLHVGAMVRVQTLATEPEVPALVREMAHREGPNTFRNQGTVGGAIVTADPESELLAALLVYEAEVTVQTIQKVRHLSLSDFLTDVPTALQKGLLTEVSFSTEGVGAAERVARTPADKPIVAAVGRRKRSGELLLAFCGVAHSPVLLTPEAVESLNPPADFRGSSDYRRRMAVVLSQRVVRTLNQQQGA